MKQKIQGKEIELEHRDSILDERGTLSVKHNPNKYQEARELVISEKKCSVPFLQRKLKIGYLLASNIVDELEKEKIIGPSRDPKPRDVLVGRVDDFELNKKDSVDEILEEFDERFDFNPVFGENSREERSIKDFLIKALISQLKSLREELDEKIYKDKEQECNCRGWDNAIKDTIANIDQKIINLEEKII